MNNEKMQIKKSEVREIINDASADFNGA